MKRIAWVALALVGCGVLLPRSAFDEELRVGKFAFAYGEGAEWYGYDVLHVTHDGDARYVFSELPPGSKEPRWREHRFRLDEAMLNALKAEINDAGLVRLRDSYGSEGQHAFVWVRVGGQQRLVRVQGTPPLEFVRVAEFAQRKILDPQRPALENAATIDADEGRAAADEGLGE